MPEDISVGAVSAKKRDKSLIAMGLLLLGSLAATGWLWHRSATERAATDTQSVQTVLHLESFVVNLSGGSENGYLRIGIDLGLGIDLKENEKQGTANGRLRDAILSVLANQTVDGLLTAEGKSKLKQDVLAAINNRVPELRCREVYFTEFLVQR